MPADNGAQDLPTGKRPAPGSLARILTTLLLASLNNGPLAATRLILPLVAFGLGADKVAVGALAALLTVVPMLFNVAFGRWVDRVGSLVPFLCASGMMVAAGLIFNLAPGIPTLAILAGLVGASTNFAHLAATRAVAEGSGPGQRVRNLGWLLVSHSLFQFLTPLVAGFVYESGGARVAMAIASVSGLLAFFGILSRFHYYSAVLSVERSIARKGSAIGLMRYPGLGGRLAYSSVFISVITIFPFVIALHANHVGLPASQAGLLLGAMSAGSLASRMLAGTVTRLMPARRVLLPAMLLGAVLYALLPLVQQFWPLFGLSGLLGLSLGIGVPIALGLTYDAAPEGRANEAVGVGQMLTNVQQTLLPLALGLIASGPGEAVMIWLIAAMMLATVALARA